MAIEKQNNEVIFSEESAASRIGKRIRTIRIAKGLSQGMLGALVGLNADRIQKYENGARKPKPEMLKKIADALEVSPLAIDDPTTASDINAMYMLFDLEAEYGLNVEKHGDSISLSVNEQCKLYHYFLAWYEEFVRVHTETEAASSDQEKQNILDHYRNWKWNIPDSLNDSEHKDARRERIKKKIQELEAVLENMDK